VTRPEGESHALTVSYRRADLGSALAEANDTLGRACEVHTCREVAYGDGLPCRVVLDGEHELTREAEDIYASAHREMDLCGGGAGICLQFAIGLGGRCGLRRRLWGGLGHGYRER